MALTIQLEKAATERATYGNPDCTRKPRGGISL